jgi:hypothetical protein
VIVDDGIDVVNTVFVFVVKLLDDDDDDGGVVIGGI